MGPRYLFFRTNEVEKVTNYLLEVLDGKVLDFLDAVQQATEDNSIIFITDPHPTKTKVQDAKVVILVREPASTCFLSIINSHVTDLIDRIDMGPGSIVMRIAGKKEIVEEEILGIYDGKKLSMEDAINEGEKDDTLLFITHQQLSLPIKGEELLHASLLLHHPASQIFRRLRNEGILLITQSLEDKKWYELRINIYDVQGKYQEHYERLNFVLTHLELGMVLEEGWTRDHALTLFTVLAYQIRFFTFYKPEEIKRILLGLEYNQEGNRWVDLDLYYRNKKISWVDIDKRKGKRNKVQECMVYRKKLLEQLSEKNRKILLDMEEKLLKLN